ncbi:MAG: hypothetical protein LBF05_00225, partial [Tannerella sp.]|nr:hypothetical protein [Tannerella sp.]
IASHRLMLRAALVRKLANGLFAYLPMGLRSFRKLEAIIREEMDAIGSLKCKPPVVVSGELWKEVGPLGRDGPVPAPREKPHGRRFCRLAHRRGSLHRPPPRRPCQLQTVGRIAISKVY